MLTNIFYTNTQILILIGSNISRTPQMYHPKTHLLYIYIYIYILYIKVYIYVKHYTNLSYSFIISSFKTIKFIFTKILLF